MKPLALVLDDDESVRFGFSQYLSKAGYHMREANSISKAISILAAMPIDALIMELSFPDGSGLDQLAGFRRDYPRLTIIIVTGMTNADFREDSLHLGADDFLIKPVRMDMLSASLQKSIRKRKRGNGPKILRKGESPEQ